jgi:hypothetical protein
MPGVEWLPPDRDPDHLVGNCEIPGRRECDDVDEMNIPAESRDLDEAYRPVELPDVDEVF